MNLFDDILRAVLGKKPRDDADRAETAVPAEGESALPPQDRLIVDALSSERYLTVRDIYTGYIAAAAKAEARSKPTDGIFGIGRDARSAPCHEDFYYALSEKLDQYAREGISPSEADAIVDLMLTAPAEHRAEKLVFPMMFAAAGLAEKLAGFLAPGDAERLALAFDGNFPKLERMPAQEKLLKALYKRARML